MKLATILSVVILVPFLNVVSSQESGNGIGVLPAMTFQHQAILDQMGEFVMHWTPLEEEIQIKIEVETTGFVGLGFSPSGGMKGADIMLAWVDDSTGKLHAHDRYAHGKMTPVVDEQQDIKVLGGHQNDTHTIVIFSRRWDTCDKDRDVELSGDTTRVIWAYSYRDPEGPMDMSIHDKRGTKSMYLREPRFNVPTFSEDVKSVDLLATDVMLPDYLDTFYWCQIYQIPNITSKNQMIGYVPVVTKGNHQKVHHILLNECHLPEASDHYEQWLTAGGRQCLIANMPPSWNYCSHTIVAWAIGSEGEIFPEHVGLPLGEDYGGSNYLMMQIHYDNPNKDGVRDNSGLKIYYTDKPRDIDGGVIMIGASVSATMVIPPKQQWTVTGICSGECTGQGIPKEGIRVFQGLLHAHLLGRALRLRHIRNGLELPTLFKDMNYDFNYQQQRILKEDMVILPGDTLVLECDYDSYGKTKPTYGGEGTNDEMCLSYLTYYPRVNLSQCLSGPQLKSIYEPLGVVDIKDKERISKMAERQRSLGFDAAAIKAGDQTFLSETNGQYGNLDFTQALKSAIVMSPKKLQNKNLLELLNDPSTWKNPKSVAEFKDRVNYEPQAMECQMKDTKHLEGVSMLVKYPEYISFKPLEDSVCSSVPPEETVVSYEIDGTPRKQVQDSGSTGTNLVLLSPSLMMCWLYMICQALS